MEKTNFTDDNFCRVEGGKSNKDGNEKRNRSSWRGWRKRGTGRGGNVQVKGDAENSIFNILSNGEGESKRIQSKRGRGQGFRGRNSYRGNRNRQTLLQVEESCSGDIVDNGGNGYNMVKNDRYTYYRRSRQKKKIDETCASAMKDTRNDNSELGISFSDVEYKEPGVKNEQSQRGRFRGSFKQRYGSRENECVQRDNDTVTCIKGNGENDCNQRPCSSPNRGRGGNRSRGRGGRQKKRQDILTVETYQSKTTNDNDNISFFERESWRGRGWYRGRGSYRGGEKFNQGRNSAKMNNHRGRSADVKVPPTTNLNNGAEEKHISLAFQSAKRNSVVTPTLASETSRDDCTVPNSKQTVGKIIFLQKSLKVASPIALQNVPSVPRDKHGQASNKIINQLNSKSSSLIKQSSSSVSSISSSNLSKVSHTEPVRSSKLSSVTKIDKFNTSATSSSAKTTTNSVTSAAAVKSKSLYVPSNKVQDSQSFSSISAPKVASSSTNKLSSVTNKDKFNTSATSASAKTTTNSVTSAAAVTSISPYVPSNKVQDSQSSSSISAPKVASTNKLSSVTNKDKFNTSATSTSAKTTTNSVTSAAAVTSISPYVPSNKVQDSQSSSSISAPKVASTNKLSSVTNKDKFNTSATSTSAKTTTNSVTSAAAVTSISPYVPSNKVQDSQSSSSISAPKVASTNKLSSVTNKDKFNTSATSTSAKTTTNSVTSAAAVTSISPYVPSNKVQDSQSSSSISAPKVASTNKLSSVTNKDKFNTSATSTSAKTTTNSVTSAAAVKSKFPYVPSNKVQDSQSSSSISAPKVASTNKLSSVTNKDKFNTSATSASAKTTTNSVTSAAAVKSKSPYVPSNKVQDIHSSSSISAPKVTSPNNANMFHRTASLPSKNSSFGMALTAKSKISENTTLSPTLSLQSQNLKKISYIESKDSTINKLSFDVRNSCKLVIKSYGNVVHGKSDIIVSFLESTMTMRNTPTGQAILLASPTHEEELKHYKLQPSTQILFIHTPRNLTCKAVCHIVLQPWQLNFSEPFFHRSLNLVFREVEKIQAKSVSFPPLGCDSPFFFPTTTAVQSFLEFLSDLNIDDSLKKIVVHATSSDLFQEFKRLAPYYFDRAENRQKIKTQTLIQQIQPLQRNTVNFLKYAIEKDEIFPIYWKLRTPEINNGTETNETTWTGIFVKIIVTAVSSWFGGESTPCFKQATLENVDYETKAAITTLVKRTLHPDVIGHGADAFGVRYSSVKVIDVKRIENPTLFKKYHATRKFMMEKMIMKGHLCQNIGKLKGSKGPVVTWDYLPDSLQEELYSEINENYLFHGTNTKAVHSIIENGFDLSYSKDWSLFGKGIYGAEKAMKSDQYADNKDSRCPNGTKLTMILTRMLLGNVFVCDENNKMVSRLGAQRRFRHPPCMYCQVDLCYCGNPDHYDSVMGDGKWLFREFVVYNASQCYPEYVITYERV